MKGVNMKKLLIVTFALVFVSTFAFGAAFNPTKMTITGNNEVLYEFGGKSVEIPFTITGTQASIFFVVTTKGKASSIVGVRNGYHGWHYVNKIDTVVYLSQRFTKQVGATSITWDGKDKNGNAVAADQYYYYLWGFNNLTPREEGCHFLGPSSAWDGKCTHYFDYDFNGIPYTQPEIFSSLIWWQYNYYQSDLEFSPQGKFPIGTCFQWKLGWDPFDLNLMQTTFVTGYSDPNTIKGLANRDGKDTKYFYYDVDDLTNKITTLNKYEWVTDGDAKLVEDFGGWDNFTWANPILTSAWSVHSPIFTNNQYLFIGFAGTQETPAGQDTNLIVVTHDGDSFNKTDFPGWYFPDRGVDDEGNPRGANMRFSVFDWSRSRTNGWAFMAGGGCIQQFVDLTRVMTDYEDNTDLVVWENSNGDYYMDTNSLPDAALPWDCMGAPDTGAVFYQKEDIALDKYNFQFLSIAGEMMVEIGLYLPDGTGCGEYMKYSDTVSNALSFKSARIIQNGGAFDGIYTSGLHAVDSNEVKKCANSMFCAADDFRGMITNEPSTAVEEDAATAFSVAQNAPNPFNPTTTINFTIPKAGNVMVDVYNVAGQKIATLANGHMNVGTHSIVWDAAGFSAGVYFYTVKAGEFTKTMKMTLLK